jgi:WhiB family redox-sensing transcriptional regulator
VEFPDLSQALCREVGTEFFYPEDGKENDTSIYSFARKICSGCEVKQACLDWGIRHEGYGMWGGMTPRERMAVRKKMNITLDQVIASEYV